MTVKALGEGGDNVVLNRTSTHRDRLVVWVTPPPSALIVTVLGPRVAVAAAVNETVVVHVGLHGLLVKVAVTPVGSTLVEKVIA
jgi:hypothetical protein